MTQPPVVDSQAKARKLIELMQLSLPIMPATVFLILYLMDVFDVVTCVLIALGVAVIEYVSFRMMRRALIKNNTLSEESQSEQL
tara:strand:- start:1628 stop:1879 length:252 start_codon:yes stop_codon:yes gene_type:complete